MKLLLSICFAALFLAVSGLAQSAATPRFAVLDIYVEAQGEPLAAYQLEISTTNSLVRISGIEGGEHAAFQNPPYYDPKAMQTNRVILAAFSKDSVDKLPVTKTRVASIHYLVTGQSAPEFSIKLITAGTSSAKKIKAEATFIERKTP